MIHQLVEFAAKAALDNLLHRDTKIGKHLPDDDGIGQVFALIVGDESNARAVVLPEPRNPPAKISFTGFSTASCLVGGLI